MSHFHHHTEENNYQRKKNKSSLTLALFITATIMLLEFLGGIYTNSLALLSDAGHMFTDAISLALSLLAMWLSNRPPSAHKTYGYYRFEILAALFNGISLFIIAGIIISEAYHRLLTPPTVTSGTMIVVSSIGLFANLLSAWILIRKGDTKENVNVRSAYLHVLGDALGSVGAIIAGILMYFFAWYITDPIISVVVALLILKSAWDVVSYSAHILMEGTPSRINRQRVEEVLLQIPQVKKVHDLHIWTITSGFDSLSCHLLIEDNADTDTLLQLAIQKIEKEFHITHTTLQIEKSGIVHKHGHNC